MRKYGMYAPESWLVVKPVASIELFDKGLRDAQDLISYCARVSNPSNEFNTETAKGLINYLIKNKHWSPLEMVSVTVGLKTTRDIARQFLRHRSMKFQEFSQRYADVADMGGDDAFVLKEARLQDTKNRQNSIEFDNVLVKEAWLDRQTTLIDNARSEYNWAIGKGIAKEVARSVLPEGNTVSRLFANGDIRSWIHYIQLRSGNGTQKEHMMLAREIAKVIAEVFPMTDEFVQDV